MIHDINSELQATLNYNAEIDRSLNGYT